MGYIEKIKEFVTAFPYWKEAVFFIGGIICICILQAVRRILRTRRYKIEDGRRSMVVIESRNRRNRKKSDVNTQYFQYIKNAQYSADERESTKDKKAGIKLIK
jgi:hypothetical protein